MRSSCRFFRSGGSTFAAALALVMPAHATLPGFAYATDTNNQIVSIDLSSGQTSVYTGQTLFPANALGYADSLGTAGSVIYSSSNTLGELAVWDRATNTHTDIGNITNTTKGYTNPYAGSTISDAAYWSGGMNLAAGYYVVSSTRNLYCVSIGSSNGSLTITNVTLVATLPTAASNGTLSSSFSFGDIAFNPTSGILYLSDSSNGLFTFNVATGVDTKINSRYDGQLAFGANGTLYGVGNSNGTANSQGNDFYTINADGSISGTVLNTDPGATYRDFAGAAAVDIVPEPGVTALISASILALMLAARQSVRR